MNINSDGDVSITGNISATGGAVIKINGIEVSGTDITVRADEIVVDGKKIDVPVAADQKLTVSIVSGVLGSLTADGNIIVKGATVKGSVIAGGNVTCECVGGSVKAGHNISCGRVGGSATAGHTVRHA